MARIEVAFRLGVLLCGGNIVLQPSLLEKAFWSGKDLPESYAPQSFASWRLYHAPMMCARANPTYTHSCFSLSIPATILTQHSNKSNCSETGTRTDALPS